MLKKNTVVINQLSENRADTVGFCRYLNNDKVNMLKTTNEHIANIKNITKGKHVLVINDTTEFNYKSHINFLDKSDTNIGPAGNNEDIGFFLHPGLVVNTENGLSLGFSYVNIWNRNWNKKNKNERNYKKQDIEEKESYRWIECGLKSKEAIPSAKMITIVADRESDIYEEFVIVPDKRTNLLIRSRCNRLLEEGGTLYERLNNTANSGVYNLKVKTTKNRKGRNTEIEIKYTKVKIRKPNNLNKKIPKYVELNVVEAKEKTSKVPTGEKPIHWILLTTHEVTNFEEAIQIVRLYAMRWQIELLFNTMKTGGLNMESSELEKGKALKKLCIMAMFVALHINQLRQARNDQTGIKANIIFSEKQMKFLKILIPKFEGKTEKQKNPYTEKTLAWAAWAIARMGGWKGYLCESPPGNKTFKWGLDRFDATYEGYEIAKKDVCIDKLLWRGAGGEVEAKFISI